MRGTSRAAFVPGVEQAAEVFAVAGFRAEDRVDLVEQHGAAAALDETEQGGVRHARP